MIKKIGLILTLALLVSNVYAACEIKTINSSSKYDYINTALDIFFTVDKDQADFAQNKNTIDLLANLKKFISHNNCALENLNNFESSNKESIKQGLQAMRQYIIDQNKFEQALLENVNQEMDNIYNGNGLSDTTKRQNHLADLKNFRDEVLVNEEIKALSSLGKVALFEQNDDLNVNFSAIKKEDRFYTLGLTNSERVLLINKMADKAKYNQLQGLSLIISLSLFAKEITFENKRIVSLDTIKKYAKPTKAKI